MLIDYLNIIRYHIVERNLFSLKVSLNQLPRGEKALFKRCEPVIGKSDSPAEFIKKWIPLIRNRFYFHPENRKDFFLQLLQKAHPSPEPQRIAEGILRKKMVLFGEEKHLWAGLDWHKDYLNDKPYAEHISSAELSNVLSLQLSLPSNGADVRAMWELSRCHWGLHLGKAYWLTGRSAYASGFFDLFEDWLKANPLGYGPHWMNAMEVAIRACNLTATLYYFLDLAEKKTEEDGLDFSQRIVELVCQLYDHGQFIASNLEYTRRTGNHLIANALGLVTLGCLFRGTKEGNHWVALGKMILNREIFKQVYSDGVDYEMSVSYHRFVTEMYLAAIQLLKVNGQRLTPECERRVEDMLKFMAAYTRKDGSAPLVGDSDDGRLYLFNPYANPNDHRDTLALGAVLFENATLAYRAERFSESALWMTGVEGWEKFQQVVRSQAQHPPPQTPIRFPQSGFAVLTNKRFHLFIDAAPLGKNGWGGHGHNDTLSFELFVNTLDGATPLTDETVQEQGAAFVTDSGTFCYTSDRTMRAYFRSTKAHNTLMLGGRELAEFENEFKVKRDLTEPVMIQWDITPAYQKLVAEHYAYRPHVHRRTFKLEAEVLTITDNIYSSVKTDETAEIFYHFSPRVSIERITESLFRLRAAENPVGVMMQLDESDFHVIVEEYLYSETYGHKTKAPMMRIKSRFNGNLHYSLRFIYSQING